MAEVKKAKKIWDNCKYIGEIKRSDATLIKFELVSRDGVKYINMRDWYKRKRDDVWMPGMSGFAVPLLFPIDGEKQDVANQVVAMIQEAIKQSTDFKLEDAEHAVWAQPK